MTEKGPRRPGKALLVALLLVLLLALQAGLHYGFRARYPDRNIENLIYLPKGNSLKLMSLGFRNVLADALWMRAVGYFGGHSLTDRRYPWLYHILDQITTLDPPFRHPYSFGGVVLALLADSPAESTALLRKGMAYYPDDWRYPFYIGFNYFYYLKDPDRAAEFIHVAATLPAHPQYLPYLAASLMTKAGRMDAAVAFLETLAANESEDYLRQQIYRKIEKLKAGQVPEGLEGFLGR